MTPRTMIMIAQDGQEFNRPCDSKKSGTHPLDKKYIDIEIKIKLRCFGDESFWKVLPQTYSYYKI